MQNVINAGNHAAVSTKVEMRKSLWGYKGDDRLPFLKITMSDPKFVSKIRDQSSFLSFCFVELPDGGEGS